MTLLTRALRRALPVGVLFLALSAAPTLAWEPTVQVFPLTLDEHLEATDMAARGGNLVASFDAIFYDFRYIAVAWSTDDGTTWADTSDNGGDGVEARDSQSTICAGRAVIIYRSTSSDPTPVRTIETSAIRLDDGVSTRKAWAGTEGARKPDIACVANYEVVTAWFEKDGSGYDVRVRTRRPAGTSTSVQSFDLGSGTVGKGLAIATSSTRVYVAWFQGNKLKLTRFSISGSSHHDLSKLGTSTIATLADGMYPEIGADGDRVILAYMDRADLKVRRSTNRGVAWGSAQTLRNEPFPSEIGAFPTTVAVKGSKVAIGGVEIAGDISGLTGKGLGYRSTNGGSSYTKVSTHGGSRTLSTLVKVGSVYKYAEAWDQSISDPNPELVRFRRQ